MSQILLSISRCCGWVFCLIWICWGGGGGVCLLSLWGLSGLFLPAKSLIHRHTTNSGNDRRTETSLRKGSVDILQNSEKLTPTKKVHLPKSFLYHILSTSSRFIFYSVYPTASQSVISLNIPLTYWSWKQLVENLSRISDKHTKKITWYSFYKSISLTLWIFYYCRKTEIKENWWKIF